MAVPHSYHCAPDQFYGGKSGKDVPLYYTTKFIFNQKGNKPAGLSSNYTPPLVIYSLLKKEIGDLQKSYNYKNSPPIKQ